MASEGRMNNGINQVSGKEVNELDKALNAGWRGIKK